MEIKPHKLVICGLQGSGKTYKAKQLTQKYKKLVISPHKYEWEKEDIYYIKCSNNKELDSIIGKVIQLLKLNKWDIDGVVIDEADMYFKSNYDINEHLNDLVINHRHYNLFLLLITRRPQDIPTKIFESSKFLIFFSLQGGNVQKKFNDLYKGLGDSILNLNYEKYEHIIKEIGKPPYKK